MSHRRSCSRTLVLLPLLTLAACASAPPPVEPAPITTVATPSEQPSSEPSSGPADVDGRVAAARARLEATPAGKVVLAGIEAQGGLTPWMAANAIGFDYAYRPTDGRGPKVSYQTVELRTARVFHTFAEPTRGGIAWDGERAWSALEDNAAVPARFWALTPFYFTAMPFVLADPGVKLELVEDDPAAAGFGPADVVRVTFEAGTGDAPEDYYVVYFDKADHHMLGLRYVVSWKPFVAPKNLAHTPEKLVVYSQPIEVGGIKVAGTQTFYAFDGKRGDRVTTATVRDVAFPATFDPATLSMPDGAVIDTSLDAFKAP